MHSRYSKNKVGVEALSLIFLIESKIFKKSAKTL